MERHHALPPLLKIFGRTTRYAAAAYLTFGMALALIWIAVQLFAVRSTLTLAASIFFAGFSLLIVLVVSGVAVIVIVLEQVIIDEVSRAVTVMQHYTEGARQAGDD